MKAKSFKHLIICTVLLSGLLLSFNIAHATQDVKFVCATVCCVGGTHTGNSNDCVSGSGNCVDGNCATGETETASMQCPG